MGSWGPSGGRSWWAHFELTRINIGPIILRKKIEEFRDAGATLLNAAASARSNHAACGRWGRRLPRIGLHSTDDRRRAPPES
jgi:hypothetical protein